MRLKSTQNEERLQEDAWEFTALSSVRSAGGVTDVHRFPLAEELVDVQGTASPSKTSAVPVSRNHLVSTPRREREHGTETGQVVSNDLVAIRANATREQVECSDLTAQ
jgi:hypothetical protein